MWQSINKRLFRLLFVVALGILSNCTSSQNNDSSLTTQDQLNPTAHPFFEAGSISSPTSPIKTPSPSVTPVQLSDQDKAKATLTSVARFQAMAVATLTAASGPPASAQPLFSATETEAPLPILPLFHTPTRLSAEDSVAATQTRLASCLPSPPPNWVLYTVQQQDYLFNLAIQTGTTVERVTEVNCLAGPTLGVGMRLWLPSLPATETPIPTIPPTSESAPTSSSSQPPQPSKTAPPPP